MKVFILSLITTALCANFSTNNAKKAVAGTIVVGAEIGAPSQSCSGAGFCIIVSNLKEADSFEDRFVTGTMTFDKNNDVNSFLLDVSSISKGLMKSHFSGESFTMDEAYKGSLKLGDKDIDLYIEKGDYPMSKTKEGFLINFK